MNVVTLIGSLRPGSFTRLAARIAAEGTRKTPLPVNLVEELDLRVPLFQAEGSAEEQERLRALKHSVQGADALLVATPVFHDSLSGVLKNALDHLYDELADKVVAVIAVGGGRSGQGQALEHLRAVLRETRTWVLPRQVIVPAAETAFDDAGRPRDPEIEQRLLSLGQELVLRARQLRPRRAAAP
jgi:FMN reductase